MLSKEVVFWRLDPDDTNSAHAFIELRVRSGSKAAISRRICNWMSSLPVALDNLSLVGMP